MQSTIAIAISGGIDSLMTAALLKKKGHRLIGLHFLTGYESYDDSHCRQAPDIIPDIIMDQARHLISPIVEQLDIPLQLIDLRAEFKSLVVDYFVNTYQSGQTPNPCLVCNPAIKFGVLLEKAEELGATRLATGHYARLSTEKDGRIHLFKGVDPKKDQSYFLSRLDQKQLRSAVFPLGGLTKVQTRQLADEMGLKPAMTHESQDICFVRNHAYGVFLKRQPGFKAEPGDIVDLNGNILGKHKGLHLFTIGQRRGINCPAAKPYYVVRLNAKQNRLIVGQQQDLSTPDFQVVEINWITPVPSKPIQIQVRIRYRHQAVPAVVHPMNATKAKVIFASPQPAVTPGQGAVFYRGDEVLGGGWIR